MVPTQLIYFDFNEITCETRQITRLKLRAMQGVLKTINLQKAMNIGIY